MNKQRIKVLIKSLGVIPEDEHYEVAELIIQECLKVVDGVEPMCGSGVPDHQMLRYIKDNIQTYFGVK
jgi:hypothetical protein